MVEPFGAILGGILGHMNSDAKSEIKKVCNIETRYGKFKNKRYIHILGGILGHYFLVWW